MDISCSNWKVWHDRMPGSEPTVHVVGICMVPGGYSVKLERAEPQGFNPSILLLNSIVEEPIGLASQDIREEEVRYTEKTRMSYTQVTILPDGPTIPVQEVSLRR